ncbi:FAD-dependent oxidoreductase [Bryobacter aggregatus]|uniref:FAD-dependent oxidoreductase n=1 Tax=Bryobacter aggregatus TaxID=360054 RepID=UPI0004E0EB90|nr:BBE domain-containing protein [Bryobacter aggregatus]
MAVDIRKPDPRYSILGRSRNLRWENTATEITLCESNEDAAAALQRIVSAGKRPTIRSGGHCYEDFVMNNPGGSILDLSLLTESHVKNDSRYYIAAGKSLGDTYLDLYKRYGLTIPAGTCYSVGAGGHISGGGYGLLARLHGLTVDWVSAVDILTVDAKGKVVQRRVDRKTDADLFRACLGAGGGNFGVITGFLFDKLPPAPREIARASVSFDWTTMTESRFVKILTTYGNYWETRGKDPDTWGMFAIFPISHKSAGSFGFSVQFCNPDGSCDDLKPLHEFLELFRPCEPRAAIAGQPEKDRIPKVDLRAETCSVSQNVNQTPWLDATIGRGSGGGGASRAKYKSSHMKKNFSEAEAKVFYQHLTRMVPGVDLRGSLVAVDAYGGATNRPEMARQTSNWQRSSILKLQFQSYWNRKEQDAGRLQWMDEFFTEAYSGTNVNPKFAGTPYPGEHYEGCYINYPDVDMLRYPHWPQLYYGTGDLYPFLQNVKRNYDPNNIFHHSMSVRP